MFTQDLAQELNVKARAVDLVLEHARQGNTALTEQEARSVMGRLGLSNEKALRRVGDLSGGEKARVALSMFGLKPTNLLVLDEPSNHLDMECVEALCDALCEWDGTVLVVSHDQAFCESIGDFTHIATVSDGTFVLEERSLQSSDWSQFEASDSSNGSDGEVNGESPASNREQELDRKLQKQAYNAPKRIEKLEKLMEDLEVKVAAVDEEMLTNGSNMDKLMSLTQQREALQAKIDDYMQEWEELEEILMSIT